LGKPASLHATTGYTGKEDHTFGPTNVRKHFHEEELTLGKNRLLEVGNWVKTGY